MVKVFIALVFFAFGAAAEPGRLEGWSYSRNIQKKGPSTKTAEFNDSFGQREEPVARSYLDDEGRDARFDTNSVGDKYHLVPVYSKQQLYDMRSGVPASEEDEPYDEPLDDEAEQDSNYEEMSDDWEEFGEDW